MKDQQEEWQILCASAAVERDPAQLLKLVRRINELLEQKRARLQGRVFSTVARRRKRIFQIAYDELLLISRAQILKDRGYEVTSVLGNADAHRVLAKGEKYRIFLIGHAAQHEHSIPNGGQRLQDGRELEIALRRRRPEGHAHPIRHIDGAETLH